MSKSTIFQSCPNVYLVFLGFTSAKLRIKCLTQEHHNVPPGSLKLATLRYQVQHSITELLDLKVNSILTLYPMGNISCFFVVWYFFQNQLFWKISSGLPSECQTDWIQIRPDVLLGLIWVQTVCKSYQQTTQGDEELKTNFSYSFMALNTLFYILFPYRWLGPVVQ